jgi:hypothetical protein
MGAVLVLFREDSTEMGDAAVPFTVRFARNREAW